jgi:pimeloyl-ACP methyl ester carboxylesterase/uncharacterized protein (DUF1330 family)
MSEQSIVHTRSGANLFVRDWGSGPPVLLLAGWGMTSDLWASVMCRLREAGLRAVAFDRRGHGRSSDPGVVDYDLLADDLADVIKTLDLTGCTIVAHSGAGGEVVRFITRYGDARISRLILVGATLPVLLRTDSNPEGIDPALADVVARQIADDLPGWIDDNGRPFVAPHTPERTIDWLASMVMGCSRRILVDYYREVVRADFSEELGQLAMPVTILQGDRDVSAPEALCGRRLKALLPDAEYLVYEGVAHGPMVTHVEQLASDIARRAKASTTCDRTEMSMPRVPTYAVAHLRDVLFGDAIKEYLQRIDATLAPFKGRFRVHGGEAEVLEGDWTGDFVLIEFPDRASAKGWYASDAYRAILPLRRNSSIGEVFLIDAVAADHRSTDVLRR